MLKKPTTAGEQAAAKAKAALVGFDFWKANEGNKDGQLPAKVQELLDKGADVHARSSVRAHPPWSVPRAPWRAATCTIGEPS